MTSQEKDRMRGGPKPGTGAPDAAAPEILRSEGREPWVFRVQKPEELPGRHAEQILSAIRSKEKLHYLLYSPLWDGHRGPFGLEAHPASHALGVTSSRFLISTDPHTGLTQPSVQEIPFQRLLSVELGNALLCGWLVLRFVDECAVSVKTVFFRATGFHHFEASVRTYRALDARVRREPIRTEPCTWAELRSQNHHSFSRVASLLLSNERAWGSVSSPAVWVRTGRFRKTWACAAPPRFLLMTSHSLFSIVEETGPGPDVMSYGVSLALYPHDVLRSLILAAPEDASAAFVLLELLLEAGSTSARLALRFDRDRLHAIRRLASMLPERL